MGTLYRPYDSTQAPPRELLSVNRGIPGTCANCGFYNHLDSDVRDAGDTLQHCANCGELFHREEDPE